MVTKVCRKCSKRKSVNEFWKDRGKDDGLHYWCKDCNYTNAREWTKENPEHVSAYHRKYAKGYLATMTEAQKKRYRKQQAARMRWRYANDSDFREYKAAYQKAYLAKNKKRLYAAIRKKYRTDPVYRAKRLASQKRYEANKKRQERTSIMKYRANRFSNPEVQALIQEIDADIKKHNHVLKAMSDCTEEVNKIAKRLGLILPFDRKELN